MIGAFTDNAVAVQVGGQLLVGAAKHHPQAQPQLVVSRHRAQRVHRGEPLARVYEAGDALREALVRGQADDAPQLCLALRRRPHIAPPLMRARGQALGGFPEQPGRVALLVLQDFAPVGIRRIPGDAGRLHSLGVHQRRMAAGVRQQHGVMGRNRAQRSVQRKAFHVRLGRPVPFRLMPAAPHNPLARLGLFHRARHLGHDVIPRAGIAQVQAQAEFAHSEEMAVPLYEAGNRQHATQIDHLGVRPRPARRVGVSPHGRDAVAANRNGLGDGRRRIQGHDFAVAQHQVGEPRGLRLGERGARHQQDCQAHVRYQNTASDGAKGRACPISAKLRAYWPKQLETQLMPTTIDCVTALIWLR